MVLAYLTWSQPSPPPCVFQLDSEQQHTYTFLGIIFYGIILRVGSIGNEHVIIEPHRVAKRPHSPRDRLVGPNQCPAERNAQPVAGILRDAVQHWAFT